MKIVFTDYYTMNPGDLSWNVIDKLGEVIKYEHTHESELLERIIGADIIVTNKTRLTSEAIDNCKETLKLICVSATGFNNVDTDFASKINIPVCNAAGYSTSAVTQHVFAMIFAIFNKVDFYAQSVRKSRWTNSRDFTYYDESIQELANKNFGIIGYGTIGRKVADVAESFGANVKIWHPLDREIKNRKETRELLNPEDFLKSCDIISLHVPLKTETKGMVNSEFFSKMKSDAILINTARGPLINEQDLIKALKINKKLKACLDVMDQEPPPYSDLFNLDNCIVTPHQAWASLQARSRLMDIVHDNIRSYQKGIILNKVN